MLIHNNRVVSRLLRCTENISGALISSFEIFYQIYTLYPLFLCAFTGCTSKISSTEFQKSASHCQAKNYIYQQRARVVCTVK